MILSRFVFFEPGGKALDLAHRQPFFSGQTRQLDLTSGILDPDQRLGVSHRKGAFGEKRMDFVRQAEDPQGVCDGASGTADLSGNRFLGQAEGLDQIPVAAGFFQRI